MDGITIAYHRDRGEDWEDVEPHLSADEAEFIKYCGSDFKYLFKNSKWKKV